MLFLFSFWHPYEWDVDTFGDVPESSYSVLILLDPYFFILFWLIVYFFLMFQIIDLNPSFLPFLLVPCRFFFISLSVASISSLILLSYSVSSLSILISSVLTPHLIGWLSPFHLVLFLEFSSVLSFEPYFFVSSIWQPPSVCFCV